MNTGEDDAAERQLREIEAVSDFMRPRIERAERAYAQALTGLWLGNAGAALATLSFIAAMWKDSASSAVLVWPLGSFVLGLVSMGVGSMITLVREKSAIERMQGANSIL